MDMTSFGIASVAAITVICYLIGLIVKATPFNNDKYIPIACGVVGGVLGIVALYTGHRPADGGFCGHCQRSGGYRH